MEPENKPTPPGNETKMQDKGRQSVAKSELRYRTLFDHMSEGFVLLQATFDLFGEPDNLRILEANAAFEALAGVPSGTAAGQWISDVLPGSGRSLTPRLGPIAIDGQSEHFEYRNPRSKHYYEVFGFSPAAGQCACILLDVSARRKLEEAHHANHKKLEAALSAATAGVWEYSYSTKALAWSTETYLLHGLKPSPEALAEKDWLTSIHPEDVERFKKVLTEAAQGQAQEFRVEYRVVPQDRPCRWLLSIGRFDGGDASGLLRGITIDISKHRPRESTPAQ